MHVPRRTAARQQLQRADFRRSAIAHTREHRMQSTRALRREKRIESPPQQVVPLGSEHTRSGEVEFSQRGASIDGKAANRCKIVLLYLTNQGRFQLSTRTAQFLILQ